MIQGIYADAKIPRITNTDLEYFLQGLGKLTPEQAETLTKEVSLEEVKEAISDSKNDKSPGFDGLTPEF